MILCGPALRTVTREDASGLSAQSDLPKEVLNSRFPADRESPVGADTHSLAWPGNRLICSREE